MDIILGIVIGIYIGLSLSVVAALVSIYLSLQKVGIVAQMERYVRPHANAKAIIVEKELVNENDEKRDIPISELL